MATSETLVAPPAAAPERCPFGHGAPPAPVPAAEAPAAAEARCPMGHGAPVPAVAPGAPAAEAPPARFYRKPTGPAPKALVGWRGNVLSYFRKPVPYLEDLRRRFGNVAALVEGGNDTVIYRPVPGKARQTVFGFGPEINREVLTQVEVFGGGDFRAPDGAPWINGSMSSAIGKRRAEQKAVLSPAFGRDHLKNYYNDMAAEVDRMTASWQGRREIDLLAEAYVLAARIASRCFYGQEAGQFGGSLAEVIRDFAGVLLHPLSSVKLKIPGTPYYKLSRIAPRLRQLLDQELARKKQQDYSGTDVLSMMMRAQHDTKVQLSEDEILGNAVGLYLAGHDVPANGLIFLVSLLATHPQAASRLMEEIDREIGDGQITYEQIFKLPVLDSVFQEMLRVICPALLIFRQAITDSHLGEVEIKAGTEVLLSPYMTNTDPAYYENPRHYQPERWATIKPSLYQFLPFGTGPKRCLGAGFAEIQLKLAITKIFQRFRLQAAPGAKLDFKYTIAIQPQGRLPIELRPQDRDFRGAARPIGGHFRDFVVSAPGA